MGTIKKAGAAGVILKGLLLQLLLTAAFCALGAALASSGALPEARIPAAESLCVLLAALLAGLVCPGRLEKGRLLCSLICCSAYLTVLLLGHLAFFGDTLQKPLQTAVPALAAAIPAALWRRGSSGRRHRLKR